MRLAAVLATAVLAIGVADAGAQERLVSAGMSVRFITGTFGSDQTTRLVYVPAVLTVSAGRFEVAGYFPYLTIDPSTVALTQVGFVPLGRQTPGGTVGGPGGLAGAGGMGAGHMGGYAPPVTAAPVSTTSGASSRASGVGDVLAMVGYRVVDDPLSGLQVIVSARLKTPTASYTRGLGTGRADVGFTGSVRKRWTDGWLAAEGGFLKIGDPDGVPLRNVALWSFGGGRRLAAQTYLLGSIAGNSSVLPEFAAPVEAALGVGMRVGDRLTFTILPSVGFSRSSPSFALTAGFSTDVWKP